jgi:protein-S-isoprenylcysteine O-methyltransferase Ste14
VIRAIVTVFLCVLAIVSAVRYRKLNSEYDQSREAVESDRSFRSVYKLVVAGAMLVAIASFWSSRPELLIWHQANFTTGLGLAICLVGAIGFEASRRALGNQYSPCFDLKVPTRRIASGPYRWLSHPMYVSNVFTLIGVFIASGSLWIVIAIVVVVLYYVRSARRENAILEPSRRPDQGQLNPRH